MRRTQRQNSTLNFAVTESLKKRTSQGRFLQRRKGQRRPAKKGPFKSEKEEEGGKASESRSLLNVIWAIDFRDEERPENGRRQRKKKKSKWREGKMTATKMMMIGVGR